LSNIDPRIQMFISTCCGRCTNEDCEGALSISHRAVCKKYNAWLKLSEAAQTRLFSRAMAGEFINLERIKYEYRH
jgi:hypothetical protein